MLGIRKGVLVQDLLHCLATLDDVAMIRPMMDIIKYDVADDYGIDEQTQNRWRSECEKAERDIRMLGAQHIDLKTVAVDEYDDRPTYRQTDYGR